MASEELLGSVYLGSVADEDDTEVKVYREATGAVVLWAPDIGWSERFEAPARDKLRELLDRAAMPGQPLPQAAPTREEIDRCGYSEDPFHRCRVCYDYAAGQERDHPLAAGEAPPHECSFPLQPPEGTFLAPGPCRTCGKTYALAQAERQAAGAQAALAAAREAEARDA